MCSNRDNFFIYFPVLLLYDAFAIGIFAAFNIFSIKIPYPACGVVDEDVRHSADQLAVLDYR